MKFCSCPENWINSEQGCFYFANEVKEGMTWYEAVDYCKGLDGYSMLITNWWLGASDEETVSSKRKVQVF
jgi:hypothetical protein